MHRSDGEEESRKLHDSGEHEDVCPLPSNDCFHKECVDCMVSPTSSDGYLGWITNASNGEIAVNSTSSYNILNIDVHIT